MAEVSLTMDSDRVRQETDTFKHCDNQRQIVTDAKSGQTLSCPVCLEVFTEPKILPCCHTFCLKCLEKIQQENGEVICPQCRKSHKIPAGGLVVLLTDFIAAYEIEIMYLKSSKGKRGETQACGECELSGPVECYCSDCQSYLCNECVQLHKRLKAFRGHKVVPIDNINAATLQSSQIQYCPIHKEEMLKLYCETCSKLICRDCTLVDHRQHSYKFVEDARKQVDSEMGSLKSKVENKLAVFNCNLDEIKKVEMAASGHFEVLKAEIDSFFNKLVQSIEARRTVVLQEAEASCQKDLKQVWADKEFHERIITHISSVFGLVDKARKCTSDSEMILTTLQGINQLRILQGIKWEALPFTNMVASTPKFTEGETFSVGKVGKIDSSVVVVLKLQDPPKQASLGESVSFVVRAGHFDRRTSTFIHLQLGGEINDLQAIVKYGKSLKTFDKASISIEKPKAITMRQGGPIAYPQCYKVTIQRLICSGKHVITFKLSGGELEHNLFVVGKPQNGVHIKEGPDWHGGTLHKSIHHRVNQRFTTQSIGTVCEQNDYDPYRKQGIQTTDMVYVQTATFLGVRSYKWGRYDEYEIELV